MRRRPVSDLSPLRILTQILLLQAAYYLGAFALILFTTTVAGQRFSLELVLGWRSVRGDLTGGWMVGGCWVGGSFIGVIFLLLLVGRSKLVLDFALTIHFIHLIVTWVYTRAFPTNRLWWALQVVSVGFMTTLGVWSCRWRELRPISFGGGAGGGKNGEVRDERVERGLDEGMGYGRGRGGKGRDGGGEYEMVGMEGGSKSKGRG